MGNQTARGKKKKISRSKRRRQRQLRYKMFKWLLTAVFVVIFYAIICAALGGSRFWKGTTVNGKGIGGRTVKEAAQIVDRQLEDTYQTATMNVSLDGQNYTVDVSAALDLNSKEQLQELLDDTHSFWLRGYRYLETRIAGDDHNLYPTVSDEAELAQAINNSELEKVNLNTESGYKVEGSELIVVKGQGSNAVDVDALTAKLAKQIKKGSYTETIECPVTSTDVDIEDVYNEVYTEAQNPTLDSDNDYTVVESKDGVSFDLEAAKTALASAADGEEVRIPLVYTKAEMTTAEYEALLFRDQMGTYTSVVSGSDNRKTNVGLASDSCNGVIIMPGESFSYNNTIGEQTEERGYKPAPAYANGQSILELGGGVCQISSTLYMACLYANLQIDERHSHPYPASYVPTGLDATVAWGVCDYVFTNNTDYPIKIVTAYDGYNSTCTIMGTVTEAFKVELYTETLATEAYETKYELDESLAEDAQELETTGINGLTVQSYRRVYDGSGNVISDTKEAYSVYSKRDEVYRVGRLPDDKDDEDSEDTSEDRSEDSSEDSTEEDKTEENKKEENKKEEDNTQDNPQTTTEESGKNATEESSAE